MTAATFILIPKQPQDPAAARRGAQVLRLGLSPRAARWRKSSITCRCPPRLSRTIEEDWANDIKDASGKPLYTVSH